MPISPPFSNLAIPRGRNSLPKRPRRADRILDIELHTLSGNRVLAKVILDPALIPVDKIFEFILIPVDGQWKIDAVINEIDFSLP